MIKESAYLFFVFPGEFCSPSFFISHIPHLHHSETKIHYQDKLILMFAPKRCNSRNNNISFICFFNLIELSNHSDNQNLSNCCFFYV